MRHYASLRVALFAALSLAACSGRAAEYQWGAISLDMTDLSPDGGYGIGGGDTEAEAKSNAQKFCLENGSNCEVVTTYRKCGSVAAKKNGKGGSWGVGDTENGAMARALTQCGGEDVCKIVVTDCN